MIHIENLIIILCLSIDVLLTSLSYGIERIKIPFFSIFILNIIISSSFFLSMILGQFITPLLDDLIIRLFSFIILFLIGIFKLLEYCIKKYFDSNNSTKEFSIFNFKFVLQVLNDSIVADKDNSKVLSCKETIPLGIALSLDGISVGISLGLSNSNFYSLGISSFLITILMFSLGNILGNKISSKRDINIGWICGTILLILAFSKLL